MDKPGKMIVKKRIKKQKRILAEVGTILNVVPDYNRIGGVDVLRKDSGKYICDYGSEMAKEHCEPYKDELAELIFKVRDEFLRNEVVQDYTQINHGLCVEFADEIDARFPKSIEVLSNDDFMEDEEEGWMGDGHDRWSRKALHAYQSRTTHDLGIEDLPHFIFGYHKWIHYDGKHYDAESPEGVRNLFELPFFKRSLDLKYAIDYTLAHYDMDTVLDLHADPAHTWEGPAKSLNGYRTALLAKTLYNQYEGKCQVG